MKPVLYCLARSDLASLNPGKLAAQVGHACTAFERQMENHKAVSCDDDPMVLLYNMWRESTHQGFGTVIVLDAGTVANIEDIIDDARKFGFTISDIIYDPSYPIRDGEVTHYIPLNTVGYVFTDADEFRPDQRFPLYP